jgi:hypothetical protein
MYYMENGTPPTKKPASTAGRGRVAVEQALSGATLEAQIGWATKGRQPIGLVRNAQV